MNKLYASNADTIGGTPLVRLNRITRHTIFAKIESRNPAGSVKCRIGTSMIEDAEQRGVLRPGMMLVEPTSGNTGIALAFVAAARGYPITLTMPSSMSLERRKILKALGARLVLTDPARGISGALAAARSIVDEDPANRIILQQFENPANPAIHERTTGPEIWEATGGAIDILVSGVGTGGTISGTTRFLKRHKPIRAIAVEPESSYMIRAALSGEEPRHAPHKIQGIGAGFIPATLDLSVIDGVESVTDEAAFNFAHRLMREEGILAGISCGAAMAVAERLANRPENAGLTIVVILPDSGERYLSSPLFEGVFGQLENQ